MWIGVYLQPPLLQVGSSRAKGLSGGGERDGSAPRALLTVLPSVMDGVRFTGTEGGILYSSRERGNSSHRYFYEKGGGRLVVPRKICLGRVSIRKLSSAAGLQVIIWVWLCGPRIIKVHALTDSTI